MTDAADAAARLKHYEGKLATLTAINGMLQSENEKLKADLEEAQNPRTDAEEELAELKEEFAERLGEAETQVSKYKDEVQKLRAQLRMADKGGTASSAKLAEKEALVASLRTEGENLSRRNGELEAQARKMRSSEREGEVERERLAARVAALEDQLAKMGEAAEKSSAEANAQIEALEAELEEDRRHHASQLASAQEEAQKAAATAEAERERGGAEQLARALEREGSLTESLQSARDVLLQHEAEWDAKEAVLQREIAALQDQLREAEARLSETQLNSSEASKPLLKQIEAMSAQHAARLEAQRELERSLASKLKEAEESLAAAVDREHGAKRRASAAEAAVAASKEAASTAVVTAAELRGKLDAEWKRASTLQAEKEALQHQLESAREAAKEDHANMEADLRDLRERLWDAEHRVRDLSVERDEALRRLSDNGSGGRPPKRHQDGAEQDLARAKEGAAAEALQNNGPARAATSSVLLKQEFNGEEDDLDRLISGISLRQLSGHSLLQQQEENGGPLSRSGTLAGVEAQNDILKQQLAEAQRARDYNAEELCRVLERVETAEADARSAREVKEEKRVLERKMDVCLEILGARNEMIEQLQDDISDMKRIFHEQLGICVDQLTAARAESEALRSSKSLPARTWPDSPASNILESARER